MPRGRTESADRYAARLAAWRTPGHRTRGSAYALLAQIYAYWFSPSSPGTVLETVDDHATRFAYSSPAPGDQNVLYQTPPNWNWDNASPRSARFWILLRRLPGVMNGPKIGASTGLWGGAIGAGPGKMIGSSGADIEDVKALRALLNGPSPWRPAGTMPMYAIVCESPVANPLPTGNWDRYENRDPAFRYWPIGPDSVT